MEPFAISTRNGIDPVEVTEPVTADRLQVFGLRWNVGPALEYLTLDEAVNSGSFEVAEISESGSVPTLLVTNKTDTMVFLMAGEQLVGAKQNRVLNASLMVARKSRTPVPVTCVERGRWGYRSRILKGSGSSSHSYLRKKMSRDAFEGYRESHYPSSKQGEVWEEVDRKLGAMKSASPSAALYKAYEDYDARLEETVKKVRVPDDCCGVVFAFGGSVAGMDLFDKPATLTKLLPKLIKSYALDALELETSGTVERVDVTAWLHLTADAVYERYDSPGLGDDVRVESEKLVGAGLVVTDCPVHVELFPEDGGGGRGVRPASPQPAPEPDPPVQPLPAEPRSQRGGVHVQATSEAMLDLVSQAVGRLSGVFGSFGRELARSGMLLRARAHGPIGSQRAGDRLSHAEEAGLVTRAQPRAPRASVCLIVTETRLADLWFSHWHARERTAVVSLADWERISQLNPAAFVAYEILLHGLRAVNAAYDPDAIMHEVSRGCLFDFCREKAEIDRKLRSGGLCEDCVRSLGRMRVPVEPLRLALGVVRDLA